MEMEEEKEMEKKYSVLIKKLDNVESQLAPILSESLNTEPTPSHKNISEEISQNLQFVDKLLIAEMASNPTHHLAEIAHRVCTLQSVFRAWSKPGPTSTIMESGEAPRCSYTDLYEDHVEEEEEELDNYYGDDEDHVDGGRFHFYENPVFVSRDDDRVENQDQDEEETVMNDSETEERTNDAQVVCDDDQNEVGECEESRITEGLTRVDYDQKEEMTKKAKEEDDDGFDNEVKTHYCYKVVFWVGLIGMVIISVMAGFSDFPEYHSSVMILTPT